MVLVALVKVLLFRYSGQRDLSIGTPVAQRNLAGTETMVGLFVNTLVLRTEVDPERAFGEFLDVVRTTCIRAFENQDAPFERVVERVAPARDPSLSPLFQVMVALDNVPSLAVGGGAEPFGFPRESSQFDLTFDFTETDGRLEGVIEFATALFRPETVDRLHRHLRQLIRSVLADSETPIDRLTLSEDEERRWILESFAQGETRELPDRCVHELVAGHAASTPDRVALRHDGQDLSYGELERRVRVELARLRRHGVDGGDRVALCLDRGPALLVGLLAIFRAGAVVVPLDPEHPDSRLRYFLEDSEPVLLATSSSLQARLVPLAPAGCTVAVVDAPAAAIEGGASQLRARTGGQPGTPAPTDPAYVIYTSGSTGRPKGVLIRHASLANHISYMSREVGIDAEDCQILMSGIGFDVFLEEVFSVLTRGARLVLERKERLLDLGHLARLMDAEGVTILNLPTALFHQLMAVGFDLGALRTLVVGGEALDVSRARACLAACPDLRLYNLYGPTETTISSTLFEVRADDLVDRSSVPIGRPTANTSVYVLDVHGQPQPSGVPGELHIGGPGVAEGYIGRPELTAERFVADPFATGDADARMYRTGDRARWHDDGTLEFLGRADEQVKLRGFRIELGEIEACLDEHPLVAQSVVVPQGEGTARHLVAFYVADPAHTAGSSDEAEETLLGHLADRLPDYMRPAALVGLPELPLTPNGKVDRKALTERDVELGAAREHVAPRSGTEVRLQACWADVLGLPSERIGVSDDFFALGGQSLLAVQLAARISDDFDVDFSVGRLFEAPTIAQIAARIEGAEEDGGSVLVELGDAGDEVPLFAVAGAGASARSLLNLSGALVSAGPRYGLHQAWWEGPAGIPDTVEEAARIGLAELERVCPEGPVHLLGHSFGGAIAFAMARELTVRGREVESLVLLDSLAPDIVRAQAVSEGSRAQFMEQLGAGGQVLDPTRLEAFAAALAVGEQAYRRYRPEPLAAPIPVLLVRATRDHTPAVNFPGDLGWGPHVGGAVTVSDIAADHFELLSAGHAPAVAAIIDRFVEDARARAASAAEAPAIRNSRFS